jgi:hypothetical protein
MVTGPEHAPAAAICPRVESIKRIGDAGWLHKLRDDDAEWRSHRRTVNFRSSYRPDLPDFGQLAARCESQLNPESLNWLASNLGLNAETLLSMRAGWLAERNAFTFPMSDVTGRVRGIRLRVKSGRKFSVKGGNEGLFIPRSLPGDERLLVTEGPTDCAALLQLGFAAIGRPSCTGGVQLILDYVQSRSPREVVIVADSDASGVGRRGAEQLAIAIRLRVKSLRLIEPGAGKDVREWIRAGAGRDDLLHAIENVEPLVLRICSFQKGISE